MIYIISSGEHSDCIIVAVLEHPEKLDIDKLFHEFALEIGYPNKGNNWVERVNAISLWRSNRAQAGLLTEMPSMFTTWLIEKRGFTTVEWEEKNLGDYE